MNYRLLGRTGARIAPLVLGTDNILNPTPQGEAVRIIETALDAGINMIDTANSYSAGRSEEVIGEALAANSRRDQVVLATKAHYPTGAGPNERGNSRLNLIAACEASLRRLRTDRIDLFQLHRASPEIAVDETLSALTDLQRAGKVRYVGCSTHPAWMVMEALMVSEMKGFARFVSEQPPYNLLDRRIENELVPLAQRHDLALICWSPMAMGILAGRYAQGRAADSRAALRGGIYAERVGEAGIAAGNDFVALARAHGFDPAQAAVAWVCAQPGITGAIIGPKTAAQLDALLPAVSLRLSPEFLAACDAIVPQGSAVANFHNSSGWMRMRL